MKVKSNYFYVKLHQMIRAIATSIVYKPSWIKREVADSRFEYVYYFTLREYTPSYFLKFLQEVEFHLKGTIDRSKSSLRFKLSQFLLIYGQSSQKSRS